MDGDELKTSSNKQYRPVSYLFDWIKLAFYAVLYKISFIQRRTNVRSLLVKPLLRYSWSESQRGLKDDCNGERRLGHYVT